MNSLSIKLSILYFLFINNSFQQCIPKPKTIMWYSKDNNRTEFNTIRKALHKWSIATNINFFYNKESPSIIISFEDKYHKNNTLIEHDNDFINNNAHTIFTNNITYIHVPKTIPKNCTMLKIIMHEIGHVLKLKDTFHNSIFPIMHYTCDDRVKDRIHYHDMVQFTNIYCNEYNTKNIPEISTCDIPYLETMNLSFTLKKNRIVEYKLQEVIPEDP